MQFWATYCKVLGYIWLAVIGFIIVVGIAGVWTREGFSGVQDHLNPFNIVNYIAKVIAIIPGFFLIKLSKSLQRKVKIKK
jgi:hypothetical protein